MATKKLKNLDIKKVTRTTNILVLLVSVAILLLSGWFLSSALNEDQPAGAIDGGTGLGIETLDLKTLEKVLKNLVDKRSGGEPSPARTRNPFIGQAPPAPPTPPPEPQPQPEPQPEPVPPPPT